MFSGEEKQGERIIFAGAVKIGKMVVMTSLRSMVPLVHLSTLHLQINGQGFNHDATIDTFPVLTLSVDIAAWMRKIIQIQLPWSS